MSGQADRVAGLILALAGMLAGWAYSTAGIHLLAGASWVLAGVALTLMARSTER